MKKYIIPNTELVEVTSLFALCEGSEPMHGNVQGNSGGSGRDNAPKRHVF